MTWGWIMLACYVIPLYIGGITENKKVENICKRIVLTVLLGGINVGLVILEISILKEQMLGIKIFMSMLLLPLIAYIIWLYIRGNIILNKEWRETNDRTTETKDN